MKRFQAVLFAALLVSPTLAFAWCDNCTGDCCACPGQAQCLGSYSSCEEACGGGTATTSYSAPVVDPQTARLAQEAAQRQAAIDINNAGVAAYKRGDWTNAISYFESSLRTDPNNALFK